MQLVSLDALQEAEYAVTDQVTEYKGVSQYTPTDKFMEMSDDGRVVENCEEVALRAECENQMLQDGSFEDYIPYH